MTLKSRQLVLLLCMSGGLLTAQQSMNTPSQSARQALVEMFLGSEEKFRRHLTVEIQAKLAEQMKESPAGNVDPVRAFVAQKNQGSQRFDSFDYGPILFSLNDSAQHTRLEAHIDSDEPLSREEENIAVSLHYFQAGVEQDLPLGVRLLLNLKLQEGTWRLNAVTFSAKVPVGDPRILEKPWWNPQNMNLASLGGQAPTPVSGAAVAVPDSSKMAPFRAVRMISLAESLYAQQHPEVGYTCGITNLVNVGKGSENGELYKFMDPEFADGVYNGYRYSLVGCDGKPVRTFQVTAEPLNGQGRAYCSDDRHNLRSSDDGKASTCLAQGKVAWQ